MYTSTLNVKKICNSRSRGRWPTLLDGVKSEIKTTFSPPLPPTKKRAGYEATRAVLPAIFNSWNREQVLIFYSKCPTLLSFYVHKDKFGLKFKAYFHCLRNSWRRGKKARRHFPLVISRPVFIIVASVLKTIVPPYPGSAPEFTKVCKRQEQQQKHYSSMKKRCESFTITLTFGSTSNKFVNVSFFALSRDE